MHRVRALLTVAVALVAATLTLSVPAHAGGPTSALLSVPGEGKTASLYYTDPEYDALAGMLGADIGDGTSMADASGRSHATGPGVTVTWLIHDVTPWRVDHIYLLGEEAPWVATQVSGETGNIWESPVIWHKPASPDKLVALLDDLGVGAAAKAAGTFNGVEGSSPSSQTTPAGEPAAAPPAEPSALAGLWWAAGGVAIGMLLTLVLVRVSQRDAELVSEATTIAEHEHDVREPRGEGLTVAEELSWPAPRS